MTFGHSQVSSTPREGPLRRWLPLGTPRPASALTTSPYVGTDRLGGRYGRAAGPTDLPTRRMTTAMCRRSRGWCLTRTPLRREVILPVQRTRYCALGAQGGEWPSPRSTPRRAAVPLCYAVADHPRGGGPAPEVRSRVNTVTTLRPIRTVRPAGHHYCDLGQRLRVKAPRSAGPSGTSRTVLHRDPGLPTNPIEVHLRPLRLFVGPTPNTTPASRPPACCT